MVGIFDTYKKLSDWFPKWLKRFTFPPALL